MIHLISTKQTIYNAKTAASDYVHIFVDAFVENYASGKYTIDCRFCVEQDEELTQIEQATFEVPSELIDSMQPQAATETERRKEIATEAITAISWRNGLLRLYSKRMAMKLPVMIPVGRAYDPENQNALLPDFGELRYALRGLHQHGRNVGRVHLVFGTEEFPTWLNRDKVGIRVHADIKDHAYKQRNIYLKVLSQFEYSDSFLFMNDDHFLLKEFDITRFPNYVDRRTLPEVAQALRGHGDYAKTLSNTAELLKPDARYFDVHAPIIYRLYPWLTAFSRVPTAKAYGFCLKSIYGNISKLTSVAIDDCKITGVETAERIREKIAGRPWFSTGDHAFGRGMLEVLNELYPNPSPYEKA